MQAKLELLSKHSEKLQQQVPEYRLVLRDKFHRWQTQVLLTKGVRRQSLT